MDEKYVASSRIRDQINKAFVYHAPKDDQPQRYVLIRDAARGLAELYASCAPESRELSLALTKLEESVMHVNAAIARNE